MSVLINVSIIKGLYKFIHKYYQDKTLADFIISNFLDENEILSNETISPDIFFKILSYLQKISGDQLICFNAGRHFTKNDLFRHCSIPDIRFSLKRTYHTIHKILESIFPFILVSVKSVKGRTLTLSIEEKGESARTNIYFYEYLRGIISSIPEIWDLPFADVSIASYPFHLEEILKDLDVIYQKKDDYYSIYENQVAEEKPLKGIIDKENHSNKIQIITNDLYIKDIFLKKDTVLNSSNIQLSVKWKNISPIVLIFDILFALAGISIFFVLYFQKSFSQPVLISSLIIYYMLFLLIKNKLKTKEQKKIYKDIESSLLQIISEHRNTTSKAIINTQNRLKAIENIIEITKRILYEKNIVNLFDMIRKHTAKALNADRATVFIHDTENHELRSGPELSEEAQEFRIPETKGIAGEIFKIKKIINVKDAYNNPNFDKTVDRKTGYHTKTILGAPLIDVGNNFIGVIQVLNKHGDVFEPIDEKILETLSAYIASALKDTLTLKNLEQRAIDPSIQKGLNNVIQYIFNNNELVKRSLRETSQRFGDIKDVDENTLEHAMHQLDRISKIIKKIVFIFNESYTLDLKQIPLDRIINKINQIINKNIEKKKISFKCISSIPENNTIPVDQNLINLLLDSLIKNSIEAIAEQGEINISIYNFIKIPNEIIHEFSISEIIDDYNRNNPHNSNIFIDFLKNRKPLLDNDLNKIITSMVKYIAFDFFDTGTEIKKELRQKIFHPFFSTKNQFGLGLAVASNAIKWMSGIIEEPRIKGSGKFIRVLIPNPEK